MIIKKTILLVILICFTSCHFPSYIHTGDTNSKLNLKEGKWLLNKISAPKSIQYNLTEIATSEFKVLLNDRFSHITQTKGILFPFNDINVFDKKRLQDIKTGSNFDFFIHITAKKTNDEINSIQLGSIDEPLENSVEIIVDIYNLNLLQKIYSQSVISHLSIIKDSADLSFAKSSDEMIIKSFKRILKKIDKNAIK